MSQIDIQNQLRLQSPFLYCQAAGSNESDETKGGIHLRWDLMKELAYEHIPKGNLCDPGAGFNKHEDFVGLYRSRYVTDKQIIIDFTKLDPDRVTYLENHVGITYTADMPWGTIIIIVRFLNRARFRYIMDQGLDPFNAVQDFLNRYDGVIEVEVEGKLLFLYEMSFASGEGQGDAFIETVSIKDRLDRQSVHVLKREFYPFEDLMKLGVRTVAENISYFRVQQNGMPAPLQLILHTYEDLFDDIQEKNAWEHIGEFSLSLDDNEVFTWFQGYPYGGGSLDLRWPKYNDGVMLVPDNYMDRWLNGDDGLKVTIDQFIQLSNSDPRANINYPSADPGDPNGMTISLLDMLRLVGLDYHGARMMGLGYIDESVLKERETPFVYAALYRTYRDLPQIGDVNDHVFLTLPTTPQDLRLPVAPLLHPVSYGLYVSTDENSEPQLISDAQGYSLYDDTRFINLSKTNLNAPQPVLPHIPDKDPFDATTITQPASFGIEYKSPYSEWRAPEILCDEEYAGTDGNPETVTTPEKETNPLYTHRETQNGVHEYALYAVNWFSRVSERSNVQETDQTLFTKHNRLLPPFNLAVQYIQEEDPLIFTTQAEQNELAAANTANPNGDNYKTRVTFDWNNIHNNAYQSANKIEFFFRDAPIKKVEGQIKSVIPVSDTECKVVSKSFVMASVSPPVTITPQIASNEHNKFIGSLLNTTDGQFTIVSISQPAGPGEGPSFIVKKLVANEVVQAGPDDPIITIPAYTEPKVDDVFFIFENVADTTGWVKLNKTADLVNFSSTTEVIVEDDGSSHIEITGGINGLAQVTEIAGSGGGYTITFPGGTNLSPHPDPSVSWIKGSARFKIASAPQKKKRLPVISIQQTSPVKIVVFDPDYYTLPAERIQTGGSVDVNFHPSYKIYLSPQAGVFDKTKTMPQGNVTNKKTYLAARSTDTTLPLYSPLTPPAILVARNVQKPVTPEAVQGPVFATRPDFYGKSTYTVDVQLNITNRTPFGLVVYRANEMGLLQALYKPVTLRQVVDNLAAIADNDPYQFNRWRSLVEVETDPGNNNQFKLFGTYRFPNPDNDSTEVFTSATASVHPFPLGAGETLLSKKALIKKTIEDVFSPLTETPIVFEYLKTGYQTSHAQPTTKSIIGRLLSPGDPSFNPFPMAVKFPQSNPNTVRFTDYTLAGNSRNIYFYFAREVSVNAKFSERTLVTGPVVLVDAAPAEKPKIRRVVTQEADTVLNKPAAIRFDLAEYIESENIKQYQVFRAISVADAATVRSMKLASTIDVGDPVEDTFVDLPFPPYGQPLFYRVVALREIINEQGTVEMIPSQPSEMMLTNIIDVLNPVAPEITPAIGGTLTNGNGQVTAFTNVSLTWPQVTYNATYHLYKMNNNGNWEKLWSKKTNAGQIDFPENGDFVTWPQTAMLLKLDDDGNVMYHRFKLTVENASGLLNLAERELIL